MFIASEIIPIHYIVLEVHKHK